MLLSFTIPPTSYLLFSPSLPLGSPLPVIQRLGVGVGFVRCIRNNSGRLSTPILYCRAGVVFNPPTSTPPFIHGSKSPILHSLLSFGLIDSSPRHHQSFAFSKDQYRLPSLPIVDLILNSLRISAAVRFRVTEYLKSSAYGLWEVNGKLHISVPHAFLVGPVQGGQGTRLHVSHSKRHSTSMVSMWALRAECAGSRCSGRQWLLPDSWL